MPTTLAAIAKQSAGDIPRTCSVPTTSVRRIRSDTRNSNSNVKYLRRESQLQHRTDSTHYLGRPLIKTMNKRIRRKHQAVWRLPMTLEPQLRRSYQLM